MSSTRRDRRRRLVAGLAAAAFLVACGGPGTYNDSFGRPAPPGTEAAPALPARDGRVLVPSVPIPPPPTGRGQTVAFCQDVAQLQASGSTLLAPNGAASVNRAKALVDRLPGDAPAEIRPAANALVAALNRILAGVQSSPAPNVSDLAGAAISFQTALQQITQYTETHC